LTDLCDADIEVLEESVSFIESLSLDVEDIRLSLARGFQFPAEHQNIPCLSIILDFVEHGTYPPWWRSPVIEEADRKRKEKAFDICKAALIKAIVEVAGEEKNEDVLWEDEMDRPGGAFIERMVSWLKHFVNNSGKPGVVYRDDMAICSTLVLGNLARRGLLGHLSYINRANRLLRANFQSSDRCTLQPSPYSHLASSPRPLG
jgi:hypothetical protein